MNVRRFLRSIAIVIGGLFLSEVVSMGLISLLNISSYLIISLIDASMMIFLATPFLYYFSLRPLLEEISERKAEIARRELIQSQLRLQTTALETAANGIFICDRNGKIVWANRAFESMTGYSGEEILGKNPSFLKSNEHDNAFYELLWGSILAGRAWKGEVINKRKNGILYVNEQTITPVFGASGKVEHFIAIQQDITERKLMFAQLEDANRDLIKITKSERRQRLLAEGFAETSMALNMSLELNSVLDHIFEQARRIIPYTAADIFLITEKDNVRLARDWGYENFPATIHLLKNKSIALTEFPVWELVCESKRVGLISDTRSDADWKSRAEMDWIRSYLSAPLIYSDRVIGLINLSSDQAGVFNYEMSENLKTFATYAAVAIQNARLYETEQHNREIAEVLSAASTALSQTLDIGSVMETLLDYVKKVLPYDIGIILLSEGEDRYVVRAVRGGPKVVDEKPILDRSVDLLNEPVIKSYFDSRRTIHIPDVSSSGEWSPPPGLTSMRAWLGIPLGSTDKLIGMVVCASLHADHFSEEQIQLAESIIRQAAVAIQNAWLFEQVRFGRERLHQLSHRLVEIQENERRYIARELHDETSQALTSIKLGLQVIEHNAHQPENLTSQLVNLKGLVDEVLENIHHLAADLRPASLDHLGLVEALESLVKTVGERSGIIARFKSLGTEKQDCITEEIETSIYRIVQESLTNVVRHAKATHADVILEWRDDKAVVIIEDNGTGFDYQAVSKAKHFGLMGMQERAELLGGTLVLDSTPQSGTTLVVEIPYDH